MSIALHRSLAVHPGDWLKTEIVEAHGLSVTEAARLLYVSRQQLSKLLNGHANLSPDMAIRFEKVFGVPADGMIRMQAAWDIHQAARARGRYRGRAAAGRRLIAGITRVRRPFSASA